MNSTVIFHSYGNVYQRVHEGTISHCVLDFCHVSSNFTVCACVLCLFFPHFVMLALLIRYGF